MQDCSTGAVVLDLGGDIGAAVVHAPACLDGSEVEVRRMGGTWDGRHASVRARRVGSGEVHAAVFESLERGGWEARVRGQADGGPACRFEVNGGRVTQVQLTG